jgi:hypothetical protein
VPPRKGEPVARRGRKARGLTREAAQLPNGGPQLHAPRSSGSHASRPSRNLPRRPRAARLLVLRSAQQRSARERGWPRHPPGRGRGAAAPGRSRPPVSTRAAANSTRNPSRSQQPRNWNGLRQRAHRRLPLRPRFRLPPDDAENPSHAGLSQASSGGLAPRRRGGGYQAPDSLRRLVRAPQPPGAPRQPL